MIFASLPGTTKIGKLHSYLRVYPYIIQQTSDENTQTYQVEVDLDQTPNSCHKFISKCVAAGGEN